MTIEKAAQKQADQGILNCQQGFPNTRQAFEWTPTFHISKAAVKAMLPLLGDNCDVSMNLHAYPSEKLICHVCNETKNIPQKCEKCSSQNLKKV